MTLPLFEVLRRVTGPGSRFTAGERWVAVALAQHMNGSGVAWPSIRQLAKVTGLGQTATRAALAGLCGPEGLFTRTPGGARAGSRYEANRYALRRPEGFATRAPRKTSPSRGEAEGFATRSRGVRHATTEEPIELPIELPNEQRKPQLLKQQGRDMPRDVPATQGDENAERRTDRNVADLIHRVVEASSIESLRRTRR